MGSRGGAAYPSSQSYPASSASAYPSSQSYPASSASTPRFVSTWPRAKALMPGGCNIPMWADDDFACEEHKNAKPHEEWTDSNGFVRKMMPSNAFCTVQCPNKKWWTQRSLRIMFCKHGMWVDFLGSPIEEIE